MQRPIERHATVHHRVGSSQRSGGVSPTDCVEHGHQRIGVGHPEHRRDWPRRHLTTAKGDGLVQQRQTIAKAAARRSGQEVEGGRLGGDALFPQDMAHAGRDCGYRDRFQAELHAAAEYRDRNLVRVGGREHELDVLWRLFERFQHRIERRSRKLVHLIDDVHLEAPNRRRVSGVLEQLTHPVDLRIGGRVQLDQIDKAPLVDRLTCAAHPTGIGRNARLAVECARQNPRQRGLADPACASEQVRMVKSPTAQGMPQGLQHMALTDHISERGWTPFAGEDAMLLHAGIMRPPSAPRISKRGAAAPLGSGREQPSETDAQPQLMEVHAAVVARDARVRIVLETVAKIVLTLVAEGEPRTHVVAKFERRAELVAARQIHPGEEVDPDSGLDVRAQTAHARVLEPEHRREADPAEAILIGAAVASPVRGISLPVAAQSPITGLEPLLVPVPDQPHGTHLGVVSGSGNERDAIDCSSGGGHQKGSKSNQGAVVEDGQCHVGPFTDIARSTSEGGEPCPRHLQ